MGLLDRVEAFFEGDSNVEKHSHSHTGYQCDDLHAEHAANRFQSFAAPSSGNIKWFVDGASYFWAVSEALQREFN
jgi:phospholipase D1/2